MTGPGRSQDWSPAYLAADLAANHVGSVCLIRPATEAGNLWLLTNAAESAWYAGAIVVEHRYAPDLLLAAHREGLRVTLGGRMVDAPLACGHPGPALQFANGDSVCYTCGRPCEPGTGVTDE